MVRKRTAKTAILVLGSLLLIILLAMIILLWPIIRSAVGVQRLEDGLYYLEYDGSYGLDEFLTEGGASSDTEVADFVIDRLSHGLFDLHLQSQPFGCSTLSVSGPDGEQIFGRNFDWGTCTTLIVKTKPTDGYTSISTVNMDFLDLGLDLSENAFVRLMSAAAPYAPMDGMNEAGLVAAVLMIEDSPGFDQNEDRPDLTTTTAIRLLLDKAATVDEALALLEQYDMHASAGMMVHFSIADAMGNSVVAEYIDNKLVVTETPIVTNFYLAPGEKYGIGTTESHTRYEMLAQRLAEQNIMDMAQVRDALDSVSKHNFDSVFASTEWSIIFDQTNGDAQYFHRENYDQSWSFSVR